jgi:hypothetical protein
MPLYATFNFERHAVLWHLGPYREGSYAFVLGHGSQAFEVPRDAGFRINGMPAVTLRVRYTSPADWVTYSPEIALDFVHHRDFQWRRPN